MGRPGQSPGWEAANWSSKLNDAKIGVASERSTVRNKLSVIRERSVAYRDPFEHLQDELSCLDLLLAQAVREASQRRSARSPGESSGLYISAEEAGSLLSAADKDPGWAGIRQQLADRRAEIQERVQASQQAGLWLRLPYLAELFELSPFESELLLLALAPEIDQRYQKLYAYLQDDIGRMRPSVDLALNLFCPDPAGKHSAAERQSARAAFDPDAALRLAGLLDLEGEPGAGAAPLLNRALKLDDRIAAFLLGSDRLDSRLTAQPWRARWATPELDSSLLVLPDELKAQIERVQTLAVSGEAALCLLHGPSGAGKKAAALAICKGIGRALLVVDLPALLDSDLPFQQLLRLALREALLYNSPLYLDNWHELSADTGHGVHGLYPHDDALQRQARRWVEAEVERFSGLVFLGSQEAWLPKHPERVHFLSLEFPTPGESLRRQLWQSALETRQALTPQVDTGYLASTFRFTPGQIHKALAQAEAAAWLRGGPAGPPAMADLLAGCRAESTRQLISFAQKIAPQRSWDDLVLPADAMAQLGEFCQQVRHRLQVYDEWGFGHRLRLGKGLIALFSGTSGTGKTLAAEVLAHELGLDLYQVDLSAVVSKYIGETEKNLNRVFQDARESNAILFFDEADALFGKRSEVKDAHDRYANIEINYLLQQVEAYEGVIILASNMSKNIDPAFVRRVHFTVEFPFPNEDARLRIWRGIFPAQAPLGSDVDYDFLARKFKIAGGNIKNVALSAAFHAAEDGGVIAMPHLMLAMRREYQKLGKVLEKADFEQYYELVR
jgi:hypothetical protein